jgi:hypothetical protein
LQVFGVKLESVTNAVKAVHALRKLKGQERKLLVQQGIILNRVKDGKWYEAIGDGTLTGFYERIGYSRNHCAKVMRIARDEQVRDAFEDLGVRKAGAIEALGRHLSESGVEDAEKEQVVARVIERATDGATAEEVEAVATQLEEAAEKDENLDVAAEFSSVAAESEDAGEDESVTIALDDALAGGVPLAEQPMVALKALAKVARARLKEVRAEAQQLEELLADIEDATE